MFYKPEVREKMQKRRKSLDAITIAQAGQSVAAQIVYLKEFLNAKNIAGYLPIEGELDNCPILHCAQNLHKKTYLPVISGLQSNTLQFFSYKIDDNLIKNKHGIKEPDIHVASSILTQDLDIIFLPLLAFDTRCNRLGRGAGHYDRALAFMKENPQHTPCLIGLGYEFQKIELINVDSWDIPLDIVVTEKNIYYRK